MSSSLDQLWCTLVTANHILDYFSLATGYGHISARNPLTNTTFFFDPVDPPSLINSNAGYLEWNISNGAYIGSKSVSLSPSSEIWIHQAIYKRYPSVNSVVHSHSRAVLPFADTNIPLVPQFNLEAVLGTQVPVFDIADYYAPNESHNFLVNLPHLGAALANTFSTREKQRDQGERPTRLSSRVTKGAWVFGCSDKHRTRSLGRLVCARRCKYSQQ